MYLDYDESCILAHQLMNHSIPNSATVALFPNMIALPEVEKIMKGTSYAIGGQNCAWVPKGAYTGAVSAVMLKEAGCEYVLVGHSERRHIFGETNEDVRKKLEAALDAGLTAVLCIGETREDREEEKTEYRLKKQLMKALDGLQLNGGKLIIAYEPVWAISQAGVGEVCEPQEANEMHDWIRMETKQYIDGTIPVIYGGSVNAQNVVSYVSQNSIDGVLVGHASTQFEEFSQLMNAASGV